MTILKSMKLFSTQFFVIVMTPLWLISSLQPGFTQSVPQSQRQIQLSFAPIVRQAAPAVVNVYASRMVQQRAFSPFADDPFFRRFFGNRFPGNPGLRQRRTSSLGSGVIVAPSGLIITNNHVIQGAVEVKVVLSDKREFDADIILKDERTDLAILQIKHEGAEVFPALEFANSDGLEVGDLVLAIGNPFGVGQTVTSGIVSALARNRVGVTDYQFFIQTDAAINPGNSGGALIDMNGQLVGINTAIYSRSGGSNGIGFAIPSNMVRSVVAASQAGDTVVRPWLGAQFQSVSSDIADSLGLDRPRGALVSDIYKQGSFDQAGVKIGDLILELDGQTIEDPNELDYRLATRRLGDEVTFLLRRRNRNLSIRLALSPPPETTPRDARVLEGNSPLSGATVANLSPALAQEMGFDELEGVVVLSVESGSLARRYRFREGDVIMSINGREISTTRQLMRFLARGDSRSWRFALRRNGRRLRFTVRN